MRVLLFLLLIVFVSCGKENVQSFDKEITCAKDFRVNAAGDTMYLIYLPSGFTPNGDGKNDAYSINGRLISQDGFEMRIFNRYGNLLYSSTIVNSGWRGNAQGGTTILPNGLYEVQVTAADTLGDTHSYSYRIHLLR